MREMSMPWLALNFDQRELMQKVAMKADVASIPRLMVLRVEHDSEGAVTGTQMLEENANFDITQLGAGAYEKWNKN